MKRFNSSLYFITDSTGLEESAFLQKIEAALRGGVTLLQLREKEKKHACLSCTCGKGSRRDKKIRRSAHH